MPPNVVYRRSSSTSASAPFGNCSTSVRCWCLVRSRRPSASSPSSRAASAVPSASTARHQTRPPEPTFFVSRWPSSANRRRRPYAPRRPASSRSATSLVVSGCPRRRNAASVSRFAREVTWGHRTQPRGPRW
ncbi:hypothetical protein ACFQRB_15630 [Halobaculum litoreum]|uniref:Uncharacterized protein n=1 Tax=Halobaculum litoreum TaxID=3031998 RepID=A0ABD5XQR4_9EURY